MAMHLLYLQAHSVLLAWGAQPRCGGGACGRSRVPPCGAHWWQAPRFLHSRQWRATWACAVKHAGTGGTSSATAVSGKGRHRTGRHNLPGGRRCRGPPSCNFLVDCAGAASVVELSLRHNKLTSTTQWRVQPARGAQVLGGLLAAAGLVAARPAAAIDVFDDRKARDNGFDIIYEARDLDLPQSTRDGMTQARPNPVPNLLQHEQARARTRSLLMHWTCN